MEILKTEEDAQGNKLEIIEMPYLPYFPKLYNNTQYVSPYTNYYVANKSVLVPEVDPKLDEKAYKLIQDIYIDTNNCSNTSLLSGNWRRRSWMHHATIAQRHTIQVFKKIIFIILVGFDIIACSN